MNWDVRNSSFDQLHVKIPVERRKHTSRIWIEKYRKNKTLINK